MLYIDSLKINNFRCFKTKEFKFDSNINIFVGNNGCGKTSVVEAISYLCLGKSFKNAKDKEVIKIGEQYFNIISNIVEKDSKRIVVGYDGVHKRIRNGDIIYKSLSEHVGTYKLLSFCPDDLEIIKGSPSIRRRFIDLYISQCDNLYLKALVEYKKILKIRNEFLKNIENGKYDSLYFDILTDKLMQAGKIVIELRKKYIDILNKYMEKVAISLTNSKHTVKINYMPDIFDINEIKKAYKIDLNSNTTTKGLQKDDIVVMFDDKEASIYSSQGQIRLCVLTMKLAIYKMFIDNNSNMIIILDDVFSELDNEKQIQLMNYIKNVGQVFITTTEIDRIPNELVEKSNIIYMKEGE